MDYRSSIIEKRTEIESLQQKKNIIEKEIESLASNAAIGEKLIDNEEYPRSDIDVYSIRESRHLLIIKQNDYKLIMNQLGKLMIDYHAIIKSFKENNPQEAKEFIAAFNNNNNNKDNVKKTENKSNITSTAPPTAPSVPSSSSSSSSSSSLLSSTSDDLCYDDLQSFLLVNDVLPDSPAYLCGLMKGDRIIKYGAIVKNDYRNNPQSMTTLTKSSINHPIQVIVEREGGDNNDINEEENNNAGHGKKRKEIIKLYLTPKEWSGRGLLGCHLLDC